MRDQRKTKAQLIVELDDLRGEVAGAGVSTVERQLAAERVRVAAMEMQTTSDLRQVVAELFNEIRRLGIESPGASITFVDEQACTATRYIATLDPRSLGFSRDEPVDRFVVVDDVVAEVLFSRPLKDLDADGLIQAWRAGEPRMEQHTIAAQGQATEFYISTVGVPEEEASELISRTWLGDWAVSSLPFRFGVIGYRQREHHSEHDQIVAELAQGLDLGFLRFLDFQKIEDQNRELTIQNALERVRARALGMQASSELGDVNTMLIEEFRGLGHEDVFNTVIHVQEEDGLRRFWARWDDGRQWGWTLPAQLPPGPLRDAVAANLCVEEMARARRDGATFLVADQEGEILRRFLTEFWKSRGGLENGELTDRQQDALRHLPDRVVNHRVFHQRGFVSFALQHRLSDDDLAVAKRFTDVFDFAYARFLELEQKEQQNRELTIQNALERVRAQALGMQTSDELYAVCVVLDEQLPALGVRSASTAIEVLDRDAETIQTAAIVSGQPSPWQTIALESFRTVPMHCRVLQAYEHGDIAYATQLDGEECREYLRFWRDRMVAVNPGSEAGGFADVFDFAYGRSLELKQKEDQNRELTIQNALERVRARALGMQSSDELTEVNAVLFEQLRGLGYDVYSGAISSGSLFWSGDKFGHRVHRGPLQERDSSQRVPHPDRQRLQEQNRARQAGEPWFVFEREGQALRDLLRYYWFGAGLTESQIETRLAPMPDRLVLHRVYHETGIVELCLEHRLSDDELAVAKRFADVFDIAYRRFRELKQKEERNRELEVERVLERVRADVASMQESRDLVRIVEAATESMKELVPLTIFGIDLIDEAAGIWRHHEYDNATDYPLSVSTVAKWYAEWKAGETVHRQWPRAEMERDMQALFDAGLTEIGESWCGVLEELEGGLWTASAHFAHGAVGMFRPDGEGPFSDDDIRLLERLAEVVALAYTRFLDFQRLEEQNAQIQQASLNKSQFLRRMSHDLRSPMNAIIGYTRILRRRLSDRIGEREQRNLANIETSSGNLLNLINDILDLSRIEAGRVEVNEQPMDPRALADECADALESIVREGVVLRRELNDVGLINSDLDRLRQVLMNLLGNATKFTDAGSITPSLHRNGAGLEIKVADTGIGIPADDLPHIFDEFRQVERQGGEQSEGTGLGLAIARKTVELLGGDISATSQVSVGTTFTVRLPT